MRSISQFFLHESKQGKQPNPKTLFDVFSDSEQEFAKNVDEAAAALFGENWSATVERAYGKGSASKLLKVLWGKFYTDHEALHEVAHYFDVAQSGDSGSYPLSKIQPKEDHDPEQIDGVNIRKKRLEPGDPQLTGVDAMPTTYGSPAGEDDVDSGDE